MKMVAFVSLRRVNQFVCGENRRDEEEGKKSSNKAERGDKAPTRNALALSQLSLSVVVVFKADLSLFSLFNLSLFVSCGGKQQSVDTLNKEEAKKLEHKSGGVKKHEHRNCSESALFSLFCCFLFCAFSTKTVRDYSIRSPWRSPQSLNKGPPFPTITI